MRISLKWLSELVDLPLELSPHELAEHLTMAGLEVEGVSAVGEASEFVVIGKILEKNDIPKRAQGHVCKVDVGTKSVTIVTNAKNMAVGDFVVVALPGAKLLGGVSVEARKVFDIASEGMFCSERELGISDAHSEVLVLSAVEFKELSPGQNAFKQLQLQDTILEIAITPNRADALSHMGIARELAAVVQGRAKFANPNCREMSGPVHDTLLVNIDAREACPRYAARVLENIVVAKSPLWLRARLHSCGIRPINNVVDVTNLVLLERGHPLHAFDFAKMSKDRGRVSLNIRFAEASEKLVTLDSVERKLTSEDLVVADAKGPLALAGVMGGESTQVESDTSTIVLESGYFQPSVVRKMARRHQLNTDASYRFERGCDPNGVMLALDRAAELMVQLSGAKVRRESVDVYPKRIESLEVLVRPKRLQEISGLPGEELDESKIRTRFALLGIETIGRRGESLAFRVPTYRPDLTREIDLIEEAMRLIGFAKVPLLAIFSRKSAISESYAHMSHVSSEIRASLRASGFSGVLNFSFGSPAKYKYFEENEAADFIRVQNPLGEELSVMRKWLLPALLENVALNHRKGAKSVQFFEIGTVFLGESADGKTPNIATLAANPDFDAWAHERTRVGGVISGVFEGSGIDEKERSFDFFDAKGALESLFSRLRINTALHLGTVKFERSKKPLCFLHPGASAAIFVNGEEVGFVGQLHPDMQRAFELKQPVFGFELDLLKLSNQTPKGMKMKALPKFPSIERDVAILIAKEVSAADIATQVREMDKEGAFLENFRVFDVYTGKGIADGKKSVALSFVFRSLERTLKDEEVQDFMQAMVGRFESELGAQLR